MDAEGKRQSDGTGSGSSARASRAVSNTASVHTTASAKTPQLITSNLRRQVIRGDGLITPLLALEDSTAATKNETYRNLLIQEPKQLPWLTQAMALAEYFNDNQPPRFFGPQRRRLLGSVKLVLNAGLVWFGVSGAYLFALWMANDFQLSNRYRPLIHPGAQNLTGSIHYRNMTITCQQQDAQFFSDGWVSHLSLAVPIIGVVLRTSIDLAQLRLYQPALIRAKAAKALLQEMYDSLEFDTLSRFIEREKLFTEYLSPLHHEEQIRQAEDVLGLSLSAFEAARNALPDKLARADIYSVHRGGEHYHGGEIYEHVNRLLQEDWRHQVINVFDKLLNVLLGFCFVLVALLAFCSAGFLDGSINGHPNASRYSPLAFGWKTWCSVGGVCAGAFIRGLGIKSFGANTVINVRDLSKEVAELTQQYSERVALAFGKEVTATAAAADAADAGDAEELREEEAGQEGKLPEARENYFTPVGVAADPSMRSTRLVRSSMARIAPENQARFLRIAKTNLEETTPGKRHHPRRRRPRVASFFTPSRRESEEVFDLPAFTMKALDG